MIDFNEIFNKLDRIEEQIKTAAESEKEALAEELLGLRNIMDKCVNSWLMFEERMNQIQEEYDIDLPDIISEGFLNGLGEWAKESLLGLDEKSAEPDGKDKQSKNKEKRMPNTDGLEEQLIRSFRRGMGFWDLAMLGEAIDEFQNAVVIEPNFIIGHLCLGLLYSQRKVFDKALTELRLVAAVIEDKQQKALVYNSIGNIYAEQEKYPEALEEFHMAAETDPDLHIAYFNIGATLFNLKEYAEAVTAFHKAVDAFSDDWEIYFYLGKSYGYLGNYREAVNNLNFAAKLNTKEPQIFFELGVINDILEQKGEASRNYRKTVQLSRQQKIKRQNRKEVLAGSD